MPSPKAHLLPEEFISNMKTLPMMDKFTSIAFEPAFHATRLQLLDTKSPNFVDEFVIAPTANHPDAQIPRTYLQIACMIGDAPLLCEMIRAGGTVDIQDVKGNTALSLALGSLVSCQMALSANIPKPRSRSSQKLPASAERSTALLRLAYIVRVLIEQHADVNHQVNGMSPLHFACQVRDWDLIALMLKHGANPSATSSNYPPSTLLSSSVDKSRFFALVKEFPSGNARPARMCPCFSGRPLFTCHELDALPYPPTMLCPCASGKSYGKCCIRRKMVMKERWNEKSKRIVASSIIPLSLPGLPKHQEDKVGQNVEGMMDAMEFEEEVGHRFKGWLDDETQMKNAMEFKAAEADELLAMGLIDPAYAYALKIHDFWPRPQGLRFTKRDCRENQHKWNATVDQYIALGKDKRPRGEIERAAKIGTSNGALYRKCEGKNCDKIEGKDMQKPFFCSACKMSVYCGVPCQKSAWKTHKSICGSDDQREQPLPSQQAIDNHSFPKLYKSLATMDLTPPREVQAFLDAQRQSQI